MIFLDKVAAHPCIRNNNRGGDEIVIPKQVCVGFMIFGKLMTKIVQINFP